MAEEQTTAPEVQSEQTINQQPQDTSFIDTLPEDIRAESSLQNFTDAGQLAKSYIHAQLMVGLGLYLLTSLQLDQLLLILLCCQNF